MVVVWVPDAIALLEGCRYDSCYPASEADSHKIQAIIAGRAEPDDHIITLTRAARTDGPPTVARWQSFGAEVLHQWHPEQSPPIIEDLRGLASKAGAK